MLALPLRWILPFALAVITVLFGLLGYLELVSALLEHIGYTRP